MTSDLCWFKKGEVGNHSALGNHFNTPAAILDPQTHTLDLELIRKPRDLLYKKTCS